MPFTNYPICQDVPHYCTHCQAFTTQAVRVYADAEYYTCLDCGRKMMLFFDRPVGRELTDIDAGKVQRLEENVNDLLAQLGRHRWGNNLGKKDSAFVELVDRSLRYILSLVRNLKEFDNGTGDENHDSE